MTILLITSTFSFSQENDELLFAKGETFVEALSDENLYILSNYGKNKIDIEYANATIKSYTINALKYFDELIEKHPNSENFFMAKFHKGNLECDLKNNKTAKENLIWVVNADDKRSAYKNKSYRILAWIEIEEENYIQALKYLDASKNEKVSYFCGTEYNRLLTQ